MLSDLLIHVSADQSGRKRVELAAELAKCTGARLIGLHVKPPPNVAPGSVPAGQIDAAVTQLEAALTRDALVAKSIFIEVTANKSNKTQWIEANGDVAKAISCRAGFADIVIVGQDEIQEPPERHPLPIAHSVVLTCGRPVLVVPSCAITLVPERVVIAWDGSQKAARAAHDALPLLKLAQTVHILSVVVTPDQVDDLGSEDLAIHLQNHGVTATRTTEVAGRSRQHKVLQGIMANGYDLIVLGAYSHPAWFEFVFGGITVSTLLRSETPMLIAH